jgi:hypothetical protein
MVSHTEPDTGSNTEPEIRRGIVLPRVGAVPGVDQLSPVTALAVPESSSGDQVSIPAEVPRGRLRSRRVLALMGGVCAVAIVAVVSAMAFTKADSPSRSGASAIGDSQPAPPGQYPPWAGRPADVRPPDASTSASAHQSATQSAKPRPAHRSARPKAAHHWTSMVVNATAVLHPGESAHSDRLTLTMQTNGDLVLRDEHGHVTWSTGTHSQGANAVFQGDGNFVVYQGNQTLWSTNTGGHAGAVLVFQADGNMTIMYGNATLWSTGTG